jgi:hypothetical protein
MQNAMIAKRSLRHDCHGVNSPFQPLMFPHSEHVTLMRKFEAQLSFYRVPPVHRNMSKWGRPGYRGLRRMGRAPQARSKGPPMAANCRWRLWKQRISFVPKYGKFTTHTARPLARTGMDAAGVDEVAPCLA